MPVTVHPAPANGTYDSAAAVVAALAAADGVTPTTVTLQRGADIEVTEALVLKSYVTLDLNGGRITLADGANSYVVTNSDTTNGNEHITIRNGIIDGNQAGQNGDNSHDGIFFQRVKRLTVENIDVVDCDGRGFFQTSNGSQELSRGTVLQNLRALDNATDGVHLGNATRDSQYDTVFARGNGRDGVLIDHSQSMTSSVTADQNGRYGIHIRNVQGCNLSNLKATRNDDIGIYVVGFYASQGANWFAQRNGVGSISGGTSTVEAEVFFEYDNPMTYGVSRKFSVHGIYVGGTDDDPEALPGQPSVTQYGVWVDDGVTDDVRLIGISYGYGFWGGEIRLPTAAEGDSLTVIDYPEGSDEMRVLRGRLADTRSRVAGGLDHIDVWDTFDRAAGAIGSADSGHTWTGMSGTWETDGSGKALVTNTAGIRNATVDTGEADGAVSARITYQGSQEMGVCFRAADSSNYLKAVIYNGTTMRVMKREAAAESTLASKAALVFNTGETYLLSVKFVGDKVSFVVRELSGQVVGTVTLTLSSGDQTTFGANTKHGLAAIAPGATERWDDFSFGAN